MALAVTIYDYNRSILKLYVFFVLTFFLVHLLDDVEILDCNRNRRNGKHRFTCSFNLSINEGHESIHQEVCYLSHSWFKFIDFLFVFSNFSFIFVLKLFGKLKFNRHIIWNNVLCWVQDIAIRNGFLHTVIVEWNPKRNNVSTAELSKPY